MARNHIEITGREEGKGYSCFRLHRDRNGNAFPGGVAMWVIFHYERLVCEDVSLRHANEKFEKGALDPDGCRMGEYKGLEK